MNSCFCYSDSLSQFTIASIELLPYLVNVWLIGRSFVLKLENYILFGYIELLN